MQNVEFKCELRDLVVAQSQCKQMNAHAIGSIQQVDTYYKMPDGRLKCRIIDDEAEEWIFYNRPDRLTPKISQFLILSKQQAQARWGTINLKKWVTVSKKRDVFLIENTRIHLDDVDNLGTFIEFEALVSPRYNVRVCHELIAEYRQLFAPILGEVIASSYCDMIDRLERINDL